MSSRLAEQLWPLVIFLGSLILVNAAIFYVVINHVMGMRGSAGPLRCLVGALFVPAVLLVAYSIPTRVVLRFIVAGALGAWVIQFVFKVDRKTSTGILAVYYLFLVGSFFVLGRIGLDPVSLTEKARPAPHAGLTSGQFCDAMMDGLTAKLEGRYNVGFDLPASADEDQRRGVRFLIRTYDGGLLLRGGIDDVFAAKSIDEFRNLTPEAAVAWIDGTLKDLAQTRDAEDYLYSRASRRSRFSAREALVLDVSDVDFLDVNPAVPAFYKEIVAPLTPDAAAAAQIMAAQSGPTSSTATADPAAWDLALDEADLAAYQARLVSGLTRREDHRTEPTSATERVLTMVQQTLASSYGDLEFFIERHQEARTAAEDVYHNKLRLPLVRENGEKSIEALLPALTRGGDRYVSILDRTRLNGLRYFIVMEGFYRTAWFRITAPVQSTQEQNNLLYRLLNMQRAKAARLLR